MIKVFLAIAFLVDGVWVSGNNFDGWHDLEQPTMLACDKAAKFYNKNMAMDNSIAFCKIEKV